MMASMDAEQARTDLEEAGRSYAAAVHRDLPAWVPPTCAVLVAVGTALTGIAPSSGWIRLACTVGGVLLAAVAAVIVFRLRARAGVAGLRGSARDSLTAVVVCALAFLISATTATAQTRWVFMGLGLVTGGLTWWALARRQR